MNKPVYFMNNITNSTLFEDTPLFLECAKFVPIGGIWTRCRLGGHVWRLYRNNLDGAGVWLNGKKYPLRRNSFYLLPPDCNLRTWCDNPAVFQLYIHFEARNFNGSTKHLCCELPHDPLLSELGNRFQEQDNPVLGRFYATALAAAAFPLLPEAARPPRESDPRLAIMVDTMREELYRDLDLDELARRVGVSPNTLIRRFREVYHCTPYHFLTTLRYSVAARLLEENRLSIDEICEKIGVNDRFHFSRMFKQRYGQSPGCYRDSRQLTSNHDANQ